MPTGEDEINDCISIAPTVCWSEGVPSMRVFVLDGESHPIRVFSGTGAFVRSIDRFEALSCVANPRITGLCAANGCLYLTDQQQLYVLSEDGSKLLQQLDLRQALWDERVDSPVLSEVDVRHLAMFGDVRKELDRRDVQLPVGADGRERPANQVELKALLVAAAAQPIVNGTLDALWVGPPGGCAYAASGSRIHVLSVEPRSTTSTAA
eukprot:268640-Prymnesium_polylepis.1